MKRLVLLLIVAFSLFVLVLGSWGSGDPALDIQIGSLVPNQAWIDFEAIRPIKLNQVSLAMNWRDFQKIDLFDDKELLAEGVVLKGRVVFSLKEPLSIARGIKRLEVVGDNMTADLKISFVEAIIIDEGRSATYVLDLTSTDIPSRRGLTSWGAIKKGG